jgi:magnesium chelatase family protein
VPDTVADRREGPLSKGNADWRFDYTAVARYRGRVSGPLLDRIDLHVNVVRVPYGELADEQQSEPSSAIRARVIAARYRQRTRNGSVNAQLRGKDLRVHAELDAPSSALLETVMQRERLARDHVAEALLYRRT